MKITKEVILNKKNQEKISMLTAYDYTMARIFDEAGIDILLVGDSYGMTQLGYETTLPVTMDEMLVVTKAVAKASKRAFVVGDMPFLSYQTDVATAVQNAGLFLKQANADAVKIEYTSSFYETAKAIVDSQIPLMGHIGLTPQSVKQMSGYKVQGRNVDSALQLLREAKELEALGVFSIVLEGVPAELAKLITQEVSIPTIGIGAGRFCDGQVLVNNDLLGLNPNFSPKHNKQYVNLYDIILSATEKYKKDVLTAKFPQTKNSSHLTSAVLKSIKNEWEQISK